MKEKTKFVCGECGYETVKWMGCCPMCGSWNTLVEVSAAPEKRSTHSAGGTSSRAVTLGSVSENDTVRVTTGIGEFDRVLGGGVVVGSTVLIGGDPGIGKSTLIMQAAGNLKKTGGVIYVSGEESKAQLKLRAVRCGVDSELLIMTETSMDAVESEVDRIKPRFLVIDSIQTMMNRELNNAAGSVTQIREATTALTNYISDIKTVDKTEAVTMLLQEIQNLNISYAVISQVNQLSLLRSASFSRFADKNAVNFSSNPLSPIPDIHFQNCNFAMRISLPSITPFAVPPRTASAMRTRTPSAFATVLISSAVALSKNPKTTARVF